MRCNYTPLFQSDSNDKVVCALIELRGDEYGVEDVAGKLQCTAQYLDLENGLGIKFILCPLLLRERGAHSTERRKFQRTAIGYRGTMYTIYKGRCGLDGNVVDAMTDHFDHRN